MQKRTVVLFCSISMPLASLYGSRGCFLTKIRVYPSIKANAESRFSDGRAGSPSAQSVTRRPTTKAASTLARTLGIRGRRRWALFERGFHLVEELVHALLQALVFEHQCVAHHDAGHARVLFAELDQHRGDLRGLAQVPPAPRFQRRPRAAGSDR